MEILHKILEQNNKCTLLSVFFFSPQFSKLGFQMGIPTPSPTRLPCPIRYVPPTNEGGLCTRTGNTRFPFTAPRLGAPSGICTVCVGVPKWRHPPVIIVSTRPGAAVPPASVGRSGARCDGVGARAETTAAVCLLWSGPRPECEGSIISV